MYVGGPSVLTSVLKNMKEITMVKKPNVRNVGKPLILQLHFKYMEESTLERNSININNVEKPTDIKLQTMKEFTQDKNPMTVNNVVKLSVVSVLSECMKKITL